MGVTFALALLTFARSIRAKASNSAGFGRNRPPSLAIQNERDATAKMTLKARACSGLACRELQTGVFRRWEPRVLASC